MIRTVEILFRVVRDGADYSQLYPIANSTPTVYLDEKSQIRMALRGDFIDPGDTINLFTDRIRPVLCIDGEEHPLGLFLVASSRKVITATGHYLSIEAYDQCWMMQTIVVDDVFFYYHTRTYMFCIKDILDKTGIGLRLITDTSLGLTRDRYDWLPGTNYLTILNDLLDEINYAHLWFDMNGTAIIAPEPDPLSTPVKHILSENDIRSLLLLDAQAESDYYSAPNVFVAACSNFEKKGINAVAMNDDMNSPFSVTRRGRKIYSVTRVKDVPDTTTLQAIAQKMANRSILRTEKITVKTGLLPDFGLNDIVGLEIDGEMSVCVERGWTMELIPGGTMTHKMERTAVIYG